MTGTACRARRRAAHPGGERLLEAASDAVLPARHPRGRRRPDRRDRGHHQEDPLRPVRLQGRAGRALPAPPLAALAGVPARRDGRRPAGPRAPGRGVRRARRRGCASRTAAAPSSTPTPRSAAPTTPRSRRSARRRTGCARYLVDLVAEAGHRRRRAGGDRAAPALRRGHRAGHGGRAARRAGAGPRRGALRVLTRRPTAGSARSRRGAADPLPRTGPRDCTACPVPPPARRPSRRPARSTRGGRTCTPLGAPRPPSRRARWPSRAGTTWCRSPAPGTPPPPCTPTAPRPPTARAARACSATATRSATSRPRRSRCPASPAPARCTPSGQAFFVVRADGTVLGWGDGFLARGGVRAGDRASRARSRSTG